MNFFIVHFRQGRSHDCKTFHKVPGEPLDINLVKRAFIKFYGNFRDSVYKIERVKAGNGGSPNHTYRYKNGI